MLFLSPLIIKRSTVISQYHLYIDTLIPFFRILLSATFIFRYQKIIESIKKKYHQHYSLKNGPNLLQILITVAIISIKYIINNYLIGDSIQYQQAHLNVIVNSPDTLLNKN